MQGHEVVGSVLMQQSRVASSVWRLPSVLVLAVAAACMFAQQAAAQAQTKSCLLSPAKLSDNVVKAFLDNSSELLTVYPNGGPVMSRQVRRLAGSNFATLPLLIELAKRADLVQVVAIGVGLAEAATICKLTDPGLAEEIASQVNRAGIATLASAFAAGGTSYEVVEAGSPATAKFAPIGNRPAPGGGTVDGAKVAAGGPKVSGDEAPLPVLLFSSAGVSKTIYGSVSPSR
jgi:hypothetical protein